jgi:hypothetical protein
MPKVNRHFSVFMHVTVFLRLTYDSVMNRPKANRNLKQLHIFLHVGSKESFIKGLTIGRKQQNAQLLYTTNFRLTGSYNAAAFTMRTKDGQKPQNFSSAAGSRPFGNSPIPS